VGKNIYQKENEMIYLSRVRAAGFALAFAVIMLASSHAAAQSIADSGLTCPSSNSGPYNWQLDQAPLTTTFSSETGFCTGIGFFQIPEAGHQTITLPAARTIHEVHGNYALAVWNGGTCNVGSIIAKILDQNGDQIASVKLEQFGVATINVPFNATFPSGLTVTSLTQQFYADQCPTLTFSWSLVMN
jgi:hypothetical protein